jgi:glycosyltransferase involved in cell wall biosynthesis
MSGFPRRSETFALNELVALETAGVLEAVFATKAGDTSTHPGVERVAHRVRVLAPGAPADQGLEVAAALSGRDVTAVHAYFAHTPAEVASHAATHLGCRWGFSTHAVDARKVPADLLADRARAAACIVACNHDVAAEFSALGASVSLIPHGVDLSRFQPADPRTSTGRLTVLAVGRLVEKKGFSVLIAAAALTRAALSIRIVGDGPLRDGLAAQIAGAGLGDRVTLAGPMSHTELPQAYADAQIVAVPSVVNSAGDRDGLPNVVLEAMAMGRPVVASDVGAVSAAVETDVTGILVPPGDPVALAVALDRLAGDAGFRQYIGAHGRQRVERDYELGACTARLIDHLEAVYVS